MNKTLLILIVLIFAGCGQGEWVNKTIKGVVIESIYLPGSQASGMGFSTGGQMVVMGGGSYARYEVLIQDETGRKWLKRSKSLWERLNKGDAVELEIREQIKEDGTAGPLGPLLMNVTKIEAALNERDEH